MGLVLAIEPDSSQADPLNSFVRAQLGAELQMVTSAQAAIVAMNQRVPDVVLFGRGVSQDERAKIEARIKQLIDEEMSLQDLRKAIGKTQIAIAKRLNVGQDAVSKLEMRSRTCERPGAPASSRPVTQV